MKLDETTLIEIQDYINELDEKIGLKPETMEDVRKAIDKHRIELKKLRVTDVSVSVCTCGTEEKYRNCTNFTCERFIHENL
jgi:hypothetical protein